ncbi:MAG: cytochrome c maturation protein CcmE [Acidobacteriia bacterium]|nr:cytochrome c maturation protein CcmE [Terriglobia bacterium]
MKGKGKFIAGAVIIVAAIAWLAFSGFNESKSYYKTVDELMAMKDPHNVRLKVAGDVVKGTIDRQGRHLSFKIQQKGIIVPVNYVGDETLPDTFVDGVQAVVEGTYDQAGVFQADKIQAKCASKYQAKQKAYETQNKT